VLPIISKSRNQIQHAAVCADNPKNPVKAKSMCSKAAKHSTMQRDRQHRHLAAARRWMWPGGAIACLCTTHRELSITTYLIAGYICNREVPYF